MALFKRAYLLFLASALALPETSCIFNDLEPCEDANIGFSITNNWGTDTSADPEGMAYLFFYDSGCEPWRFDFPGKEAGRISLPEGSYSFIMFNDDTASIDFVSDENEHIFATTKNVTIGFDPHIGELRASPDMMWADASILVKLDPNCLEYTTSEYAKKIDLIHNADMNMITNPQQIVARYTLLINHIENLSGVACMKGLLSGMSSGINLNTNTHSEKAVSIPFDLSVAADSAVCSEFLTFGLPGSPASEPNDILLFFKLSDGNIIKYDFDKTEEIRNASDPLNVKLTIDSIHLPYAPPIEGNSGFAPSVAGWTTVVVNY